MLNPVMADLFSKIMPTQVQTASSGKSMVDQTFQKVFDSLQQTSDRHASSEKVSKKSSTKEQNSGDDEDFSNVETNDDDNINANRASKADKAKKAKLKEEDDSNTAAMNKAAEALNKIKEKLEALKQNDPAAYNDLVSNAGSMSIKDILTKLGFNQDEMDSIATALNVNLDDSEGGKDFMAALLNSGNSSQANGADVKLPEASSQNYPGEAAAHSAEHANAASKHVEAAVSNEETKSHQQSATVETKHGNTAAAEKRECDTGASSDKDNTPKNNTAANNSAEQQQSAQGPSLMEKTAKEAALNPNSANPQAAAQMANSQPNAENAAQQAGDKVAAAQNAKNNSEGAILNSTSSGSSKAESAQSQPKTPEAPRAAFERMLANQVVEKAKIITRPNGTTNMTLRLDPPSLGKVDMRLEVTEDHVRAVMIAENKDVKNALQNNIEHLKNSLTQSGIKVDEIQIATAGDSGLRNNTTAQESGQWNNGNGKNGYANRGRGGVGRDDAGEIASAPARRHHAGVLDIVA